MIFITYAITLASIIGTIAKQYAQSLLYAFNFAMAIIGLIKWKQNKDKLKRTEYDIQSEY